LNTARSGNGGLSRALDDSFGIEKLSGHDRTGGKAVVQKGVLKGTGTLNHLREN
jgi:hypothetical protein